MQLSSPAQYKQLAAKLAEIHTFQVIRQLPPTLNPAYQVGVNFIYNGVNHGWILDRDVDGYKLFLDLQGDGDLSHAEPFRFHNHEGVQRIDIPMKDDVAHWTVRFELFQDPQDPKQISVRMTSGAYRSGLALIDGHKIPFRLSGSDGRYDLMGDEVSFDRGNSGTYEAYRPDSRWVNLAGKTYEFHVNPDGSSLTLKQSNFQEDRPSGKAHALRRNTADFTLLEFWDTQCGPCRQEMPKLKVLRDKLPRSRFEILGVSTDESEEVLKKYLMKFAIAWPECRESYDGPLHRLLRIEEEPTYFLLLKDGTFVDHWVGSGSTISKIEAALQ